MSQQFEEEPLVCANVSKTFGAAAVVREVSLRVKPGEVVGMVGPNGSGKSTLLRMIVGLLSPNDGCITVAGSPAGTIDARRVIGYIPDNPHGLEELSIAEFVQLQGSLFGARRGFNRRADALLEAFRLESRRTSPLSSLSNGMRRQASMVASFALPSRLYVLDEATAALDPEAVVVLRVAVRAATKSGAGLLLATQDLTFAQAVCDTVYLLHAGELKASGSVSELLTSYSCASLEEVYLKSSGAGELARIVQGRLANF